MANTVLGRGKLYFGKFAPGTETHSGLRYLGNTPSFGLSVETQELDHYNSDEGLKVKDESITLSVDYSGTLTTDNISPENMALFFFGDASTVTQTSATGQSANLTVNQGMLYRLSDRSLSNVTVTGGGGTPTYTAGTDYTVDEETGDVEIITGGGIADGSDIVVNYDRAAVSMDLIISGKNAIEGELLFKSFNPVGKKTDFEMRKVVIRPNGEFQLKGDEWQQISFNVEILAKSGEPEIRANGRPYTP